jgi:diguanylate cyclase (GGDEF)-like protein/PAS domain S-box-containing protein
VLTKQKQMERALRESEERYRAVVEQSVEAIFLYDAETKRILESNGAFRRMMGYSEEELLGMRIYDFIAHDKEDIDRHVQRSLKEKRRHIGERRYLRKDGSVIVVDTSASVISYDRKTALCAVSRDVTERKRFEEALKESEERFRQLFERSTDALFVHDERGRFVDCNSEACRALGYEREELLALSVADIATYLLSEEERRTRKEDTLWQQATRGEPGKIVGFEENELRRKDGTTFPVEVGVGAIEYEGRRMIFASVRDLTERKQAERALKESEERFRGAFDDAPIGVALVGLDAHYHRVNRALCEMLGYSEQELLGKTTTEVTHPDDWEAGYEHTRRVLEGGVGRSYHLEKRYVHADGRTVWILSSVSLVRDPQGNPSHFVSLYQDITERKALEEQLRHRALHDPLTELPNRALLLDRLRHALARSERLEESLAVLFVDLDNMKVVNDSLGHQAGDHLLNEVAERLRTCIRAGDTVARLFGDEFAVLLEAPIGADDIRLATERVQQRLQEPFAVDGREVFVSVSIGIATGEPDRDADKERPENLLRRADLAMYAAKRRGKNRYEVFNPSMNTRVSERMKLENDLRRAIEREEFEVRYEPIITLESGSIEGLEALARWRHPERGLLAAEEFVPLAEETGLIRPIGRWVFEEACRQARRWKESYPDDPLLMSVNFSVSQFAHQADLIPEILNDTGLDPRVLTIEITERAVMDDVDFSLGKLRSLKSLGIGFAIDDYGTGYSCLRYLKLMPVKYLKIDRSFVSGLNKDPGDEAIVAGTIDLAHALNLKVVAEGVETAEQLERLKDLKCDLVQGFYFSEPLAGEEIQSFLTGDHRRKPDA